MIIAGCKKYLTKGNAKMNFGWYYSENEIQYNESTKFHWIFWLQLVKEALHGENHKTTGYLRHCTRKVEGGTLTLQKFNAIECCINQARES